MQDMTDEADAGYETHVSIETPMHVPAETTKAARPQDGTHEPTKRDAATFPTIPGVLSWREMRQRPQVTWLVEGVLRTNSIAMLYGDSEGGKTFLALDLGLSVAAEFATWHGLPLLTGPVIYILTEDPEGDFRERGEAWAAAHQVNLEAIPFRVMDAPVDLLNTGSVDALCERVQRIADVDGQPRLIVLDTFGRSIDSGDELANADMHRAMSALDRLRLQTSGATLLPIHHEAKPSQDGRRSEWPRGAMALVNDSTTLLRVVKPKQDSGQLKRTTVVCKRQKGQPHCADMHFTFRLVAYPAIGAHKGGSSLVAEGTLKLGTHAASKRRHITEAKAARALIQLGRAGGAAFGRKLGISKASGQSQLKKLVDAGLAEPVGNGQYEPTAACRRKYGQAA